MGLIEKPSNKLKITIQLRKEEYMKYGKKIALALLSLCIILGVTGCVSPFYGTARIEKGFHMDAGLAATSYIAIGDPPSYCIGGRTDFEARYGLNDYIGFNGHLGLGYGTIITLDTITGSSAAPVAGNAAIGVQAAWPLKNITPAARLELTFITTPLICPTLLLGIGRQELITIGGRVYLASLVNPQSVDLFLSIHPTSRWSIFGGVELVQLIIHPERPIITLGVGYKIM